MNALSATRIARSAASPRVVVAERVFAPGSGYIRASTAPPSRSFSSFASSTRATTSPRIHTTRPQVSTQSPRMSFFKRFFSDNTEAMANAEQKVKQLIAENNVVVFSKTWCGFSSSTKSTLRSYDADFTIVELDKESDGAELQAALAQISGQRTVPNVYIAQKHIGGNSDIQDLSSSGQLKKELASAGAIAA